MAEVNTFEEAADQPADGDWGLNGPNRVIQEDDAKAKLYRRSWNYPKTRTFGGVTRRYGSVQTDTTEQ